MFTGGDEMPWEADRTPGFSIVRIQREILDPKGIRYGFKYGSGTIEVELVTKDRNIAEEVALDMKSQGIDTIIEETKTGLLIKRLT
jgi:hypothetical protein